MIERSEIKIKATQYEVRTLEDLKEIAQIIKVLHKAKKYYCDYLEIYEREETAIFVFDFDSSYTSQAINIGDTVTILEAFNNKIFVEVNAF